MSIGVNGINNFMNVVNYNQKNNVAINPTQSFDELFRAAMYREVTTSADVKSAIKRMGLALTVRAVPNITVVIFSSGTHNANI